jgi:large subunit ribosomal protein L23
MNLILYPRVSEKSYGQASDLNTYLFNVPLNANKIEIKKAVEAFYSVKVEAVNIVRMEGKPKNPIKKGGKRIAGKRSDYKKAYVSVTKGQTIPVFASEEEEKK